MLKRAYIEITNVCNLNCSFCPGTKRSKRFMSAAEFRTIAEKIRPHTGYIYLHIMGEPLLHPELKEILDISGELGFRSNITTNGTLIGSCRDILLNAPDLRKVSVSLHSFEGNSMTNLREYLDPVWDFCLSAGCITALRLWNENGANEMNSLIHGYLSEKLGYDVLTAPYNANGYRLGRTIYLESAEKFDWPSPESGRADVTFCHGLSQQVGVLCDGTVVPCCLDSEGTVNLGNLFEQSLDEILETERARAIIKGFAEGRPSEELCRHCGYASRF